MTDKLEIAESSLFQAREKVLWDEIKSIRQQLAESQAREKVLIDMAGKWIGDEGWGQADMDEFDRICLAGSSTLDSMLKQARREALIEAATVVANMNGYNVEDISSDIRYMAEELK